MKYFIEITTAFGKTYMEDVTHINIEPRKMVSNARSGSNLFMNCTDGTLVNIKCDDIQVIRYLSEDHLELERLAANAVKVTVGYREDQYDEAVAAYEAKKKEMDAKKDLEIEG